MDKDMLYFLTTLDKKTETESSSLEQTVQSQHEPEERPLNRSNAEYELYVVARLHYW